MRRGEDLKQSLGDESELDVAMVGCDLSADGVAVVIRLVVQVLVAAIALAGCEGCGESVVGGEVQLESGLAIVGNSSGGEGAPADQLQRRMAIDNRDVSNGFCEGGVKCRSH